MIEKVARIALLLDFYGGLLTEKQQLCLDMYYNQDLSLAEIAETFTVSRQAVHDILKRAENLLEDYEARLGLLARFLRNRRDLSQVLARITDISTKMAGSRQTALQAEIDTLRLILEKMMEEQ